ncbi:hypothetical protein MIMGU_mgv1a026968mg [Erythranthe guttata]|uniref:Uncharacterized protein n=1 Tax=Erythranthe guttata TaxID=4155 RepID=A0A022PYR8_ERYGU|nr:hypothetical protein MIMGU_mgv1a026968mg [Erythranthe guttata]
MGGKRAEQLMTSMSRFEKSSSTNLFLLVRPAGAPPRAPRAPPRCLPQPLHHLRSTPPPPTLLPQLFPCPPTAAAAAILTCSKCFSSSHSHCVVSPQTPYICRLCTDPGAATFRLEILENDGGRRVFLDREAANMLSAAGKIASTSINNAGVAAVNADAEKKAKEEALARRRACEAAGGGGRRGWVYYGDKVERERDIVPPRDRNSGVGSIGNVERVDDSHQSVATYIVSKLIKYGRIIA